MRTRFCIALLLTLASSPLGAQTLFNNGSVADGRIVNSTFQLGGGALLYDNFLVDGGGWNVTGLFGDFVGDDPWTEATWEIRTGVAQGSLGTLLFSGSGSVTRVATGNTVMGSPEYRSELSGLSFFLPAGEYWMNLAPVNPLQNFLYVSNTLGAGGVNALSDSRNYLYIIGAPVSPANPSDLSSLERDYAFGVMGTAVTTVPEPATAVLLVGGLAALGLAARRRIEG